MIWTPVCYIWNMVLVYHDAVLRFLKTLQKPAQAKALRSIELLETYGLHFGMPHVKKITALLFELRIRGTQETRLFFFRHKERIVLIHGFVKKTQKTPKTEIITAEKRLRTLTMT